MGREIKFRAWEKNLKEIIPVHNIDFENRMLNIDSAWRLFEEIELMQYTGLKDRDNKEIYEGDIVEVWRAGSCRTFQVVWRKDGVPMCILYPQPLNEDFWQLRSDMPKAIKIIGNIYENPELLEGKIDDQN